MNVEIDLKLKTVADLEGFQALESDWQALADRDPRANLFQTHLWLSSLTTLELSERCQLRIVCFYNDERLVAVAPFVLVKAFSVLNYGVLRFLGQGLNDFNDVIIDRDQLAGPVFVQLSNWLEDNKQDIQRLELENVMEGSYLAENFHRLNLEQRFASSIKEFQEDCHFIDLPDDFDAYMKTLASRKRKNLKRRGRRIHDNFDVDVTVIKAGDDQTEALEALIRLHQIRQESRYQRGMFWSDGRKEMFQQLFSELIERNWIALHVMRLDGEIVVVKIGLDFNGRRILYNGGIVYDEKYNSYGIGKWFYLCQIEDAIERNMKEVNFGRGGETHKGDYGTVGRANYRYCAHNATFLDMTYDARSKAVTNIQDSDILRQAAFVVLGAIGQLRPQKSNAEKSERQTA